MENYIHEENMALFKKRLAEPHGEARHATLLKLLADEEAKDRLPKNRTVKQVPQGTGGLP